MTTDANKGPPAQPHADAAEAPSSRTLKKKLLAWWEGYEVVDRKQPAAPGGPAKSDHPVATDGKPKPGMNRFGKPLWTANRMEVAEKIWGTGYTQPGGDDVIITLTKPLGLNPAMTFLDLGCGLGGGLRAVVGEYGCWGTGLEASPLLAAQGKERSLKAGMAKQAVVDAFDPEDMKHTKRVDAVFSKEQFFTIKDKTTLFDRVEAALKPRGHFLITDYVVEPEARNSAMIKGWADREPLEPHLWTLEGALGAFAQCNFDLRVHEDITEVHRNQIVAAIKALTEYLEKVHLDKDTKVNVIDEVESWALRVAALQSGLKCYRFYALKPPE
jgi:SAM-dependent methyltransferase